MSALPEPQQPSDATKRRRTPKVAPQYNRRATDRLHVDSRRYPTWQWPVATRAQRIALLDQITEDLRAGRIDRIGAYHERLRWAFRCMEANV